MNSDYQSVIRANQELHTVLAGSYDATEPQFRPENVAHGEGRLKDLFAATSAKRLVDLGCGTGFVINIAKKYLAEIDGVDETEAMIPRVDRSGDSNLRPPLTETGSVALEQGAFDVATAYSFLHHLYDIGPTLRTSQRRALRPGGKFYADLEPNYYFWEAVKALDPAGSTIHSWCAKFFRSLKKMKKSSNDFKVNRQVFNNAEYNKNITGGFREEVLTAELLSAGFKRVDITYYWYLGQASVVNDPALSQEQRISTARLFASTLEKGLPLTRALFKYVGFVATR